MTNGEGNEEGKGRDGEGEDNIEPGVNFGGEDTAPLFTVKPAVPTTALKQSREGSQPTTALPPASATENANQRADIEKLMGLMYRYYYTYEALESTGSIDFELSSLINGAVKRHRDVPQNEKDLFPKLGYYRLGTFVFCAPSREKLSEINEMLHSYIDNAGLADEEKSVELRGSAAGLEEKFGASTRSISDKVDKIVKDIEASMNKALSYKAQAENAYWKIEDAVEKSDVLFSRQVFINKIIKNLETLGELEKDTGSIVKTHVEIDLAGLYDVASTAYDMIRKFRKQVIKKIGEDNYNHQASAVSNDALDTQINAHLDEMYKAAKEAKKVKDEAKGKEQLLNPRSWVLERSTRIGMLENLYIAFAEVLGERKRNDKTGEIETTGPAEVIKTEGIYKGKLGKKRTAFVVMTSKYNQF